MSSNKASRYLQHHKQHSTELQTSQQSVSQLLVADSTSSISTMRKFRCKTQQQSSTIVSIPQIYVNNNDDDTNDDNRHVAILNEFDQVLENELKRPPILRTSSLKQRESNDQMEIPVNQQRSFSFALGTSINLDGKKHDDDDDDNYIEPVNTSSTSSKSLKLPATIKASL